MSGGKPSSASNSNSSSRPSSIPVLPTSNGGANGSSSGSTSSSSAPPPKTLSKRTRWLLCYPSGGATNSESPSPPSETAGPDSNMSTPSPTDHGFKMPNSYSNERPTSLPVALLNSTRGEEDSFWKQNWLPKMTCFFSFSFYLRWIFTPPFHWSERACDSKPRPKLLLCRPVFWPGCQWCCSQRGWRRGFRRTSSRRRGRGLLWCGRDSPASHV